VRRRLNRRAPELLPSYRNPNRISKQRLNDRYVGSQLADHPRTSVWEEPVEQRILRSQFVEQRVGVLQVGGVEAFGEPVVDLGEHRARLVALALLG
jgi:hypothetical protein